MQRRDKALAKSLKVPRLDKKREASHIRENGYKYSKKKIVKWGLMKIFR